MTKFTKFLSYLLVFVMIGVAIAACAPEPVATEAPAEPTEAATEAPTEVTTPEETAVVFEEQPFGENLPTAPTITTPLVVAYSEFSQKFSPFYSDTG